MTMMVGERYRIINADCRTALRQMPDDHFHVCVTSPPYWSLRDYSVEGQIGLEADLWAWLDAMVEVFGEVRRVLRPDGVLWLNVGDAYNSNPSWGRGRSTEVQDAIPNKPPSGLRGHANMDTLKPKDLMMMPHRLAIRLQEDGWWVRSDIVWAKPNAKPESVTDRPTHAHEYVFMLTKAATYYWDQDAVREGVKPESIVRAAGGFRENEIRDGANRLSSRNLRSVWTIPAQGFREAHFATFPEALVKPCILSSTSERGCCPRCGNCWERVMKRGRSGSWHDHSENLTQGTRQNGRGPRAHWEQAKQVGWKAGCSCPEAADPIPCRVLDPFAGTATTLLVALRYGRHAVGVELNPAYIEIAERRIAGTVAQPLLELG